LWRKPKTNNLKFDTLLAQFLYQHRKLALPGIGTFTMDGSAPLPDENAKLKSPVDGISFSSKSPSLPDEALIDFIRTHTGKMKPLAQADLDSYLTLAQQFINIGKPLFLEGIGTIQKIKNSFEFIPGAASAIRLEPLTDRYAENKKKSIAEEQEETERQGSGTSRKLLLFMGVLGTLALIGWGAYYLYTKSNNPVPEPVAENTVSVIQPDSSTITAHSDSLSGLRPDSTIKKDSLVPAAPIPVAAGNYKFVIETTTNKLRALSRYGQLKKNGVNINLETKDSLTFKLYFLLPATAADTARLKDSLNNYFNYDSETKRLKRLTTIEN
jgi:hypothetical protein